MDSISVYPKNIAKPYHIASSGQGESFAGLAAHHVLRLTLPCGLGFAFDPTGAQYGWSEILSPWTPYKRHRVRLIISESRLMLGDPLQSGPIPRSPCSHGETRRLITRRALMSAVAEALVLAAKETAIPGSKGADLQTVLCRLTDARYGRAIAVIMKRTERALSDKVEETKRGPCGRLYWDQNMRPCLTQDERMYDCLKKVWFTEKEYDDLNGPGRVALWKSRYESAMKDMPSGHEHSECC